MIRYTYTRALSTLGAAPFSETMLLSFKLLFPRLISIGFLSINGKR